jgi:hypothetical protein
MTIHAYTETAGYKSYPAYINVSEHFAQPDSVIVTVRSTEASHAGVIALTYEQARALAIDILKATEKHL